MRFVLLFTGWFLLAACASGPAPTPQTQEEIAEAKKDAKARDEFARNLPKPPER
jgi:hypothetical protein